MVDPLSLKYNGTTTSNFPHTGDIHGVQGAHNNLGLRAEEDAAHDDPAQGQGGRSRLLPVGILPGVRRRRGRLHVRPVGRKNWKNC